MKIRLTERQYKIIEQITFTPEKVNEFVAAATKDLADAKTFFSHSLRIVAAVTIYELFEKLPKYEQKHKDLSRYLDYMRKKHGQYFDVVSMYEVGEYPQNIKVLDNLVTDYDNMQFDLGKVIDILDNLIESTRKMGDFLNPKV